MVSSIHEQFLAIRGQMVGMGKVPVRVIFSHRGYSKARAEQDGAVLFGKPGEMPTHYCGLPFTIRSDMAGEIGLDDKFEQRRDAVTVQIGFSAALGQATVDGVPVGEPIQFMQIIGGQLTAAQLCDVIQGFLDADDATHFGPFERALAELLVKHGRFE